MSEQYPNNSQSDPLESIEHELYDPKAKVASTEIHHLKSKRALNLPSSWGDDSSVIIKKETIVPEKGFSFGAKLLLIATLLLLVAIGFLGWRVLSERNIVSANNIDMTVDVAPYVEGGEIVPLTLTLQNRNTSPLEDASVTIVYKKGSGAQDEQEKVQERQEVGAINTNELKKRDFAISLYGAEGETRDVVLKLEYKVNGSNATFTKFVTAQVILKTPPVSIRIEGPDKISVAQNGTYTFTVTNNSASTTPPSVLQIIPPIAFTTETSNPKSIPRSNSWSIRSLKQGESMTVSLTGSFEGNPGDVVTFQTKIGSEGDNPSTIGIVYASQTSDVTLRASPLTLLMNLRTESGSSESLRYGDRATLTFVYTNTSLQALTDASIKLTLSGDAAIYNSIDPISGYYDSIAKTITWDKATFPDFAVLAPNAQGTLQVVIPIVSKGNNSPTLKATLVGSASIKGSDDVVSTITKTFPVQGSATLEARTQYTNSTFPNSGPIPPKPNQETTYTVNLKISAQNTLSSAKASFGLPPYVTWRGVTSDAAAVTYNTRTRTVTFDAGRLEQGKVATAEIGLSVKPSQSHVGQSPAITSGIVLDAEEEVSRVRLRTTLSALTVALFKEQWPENPNIVTDR